MVPECQNYLDDEWLESLAPAAPGYHVHHGLVVRVVDDACACEPCQNRGVGPGVLKAVSSLHVELSFLSSSVKAVAASRDLSAFTM